MSGPKETVIDLTTQRLPDAAPGAILDLGTVRHPNGSMAVAIEITTADRTQKAGVLLTAAGAQEIAHCLTTLARSIDVLARRGH